MANSPLRDLPASIPARQARFFDGLRLSATIAAQAHRRLLDTLHRLALGYYQDPSSRPDEQLIIASVSDAWTVIDSTNRMRDLLRQMPGLKKKASGIQIFFQKTEDVSLLRNHVQHLNNEVAALAETGDPLLGRIHWVSIVDPTSGAAYVGTLAAGSIFTAEHKVPMPWDKSMAGDVGLAQLAVGEIAVLLAEVVDRTAQLVHAFEAEIWAARDEKFHRPSDLVFFLRVDAQPAHPSS